MGDKIKPWHDERRQKNKGKKSQPKFNDRRNKNPNDNYQDINKYRQPQNDWD